MTEKSLVHRIILTCRLFIALSILFIIDVVKAVTPWAVILMMIIIIIHTTISIFLLGFLSERLLVIVLALLSIMIDWDRLWWKRVVRKLLSEGKTHD